MIPAEWLERARGFGGRSVISLADYAHTLDQEQRHEIRGRVLDALMAFVRASLAFGAPWRGESTIRDALLLLSGTHSYLLLSLPFVAADDLDLYYGLGKVGRSRIPAGDVLCTVTASDILRHLAFTEGELHARLDEVYQDFRERIVKTIFVLLTRRIRQLRVRQSTT
jgi:hypothetical protein